MYTYTETHGIKKGRDVLRKDAYISATFRRLRFDAEAMRMI